MQTVKIKTLIDITKTKNLRIGKDDGIEIDQYKNFITLLQCIELRSIVSFDQNPLVEDENLEEQGFGKNYQGIHKVWTFTVKTDRDDVYRDGDDPIGKLIEDIDSVPIIKNLTETINIDRPVFDCKSVFYKNTIVKNMESSIWVDLAILKKKI